MLKVGEQRLCFVKHRQACVNTFTVTNEFYDEQQVHNKRSEVNDLPWTRFIGTSDKQAPRDQGCRQFGVMKIRKIN